MAVVIEIDELADVHTVFVVFLGNPVAFLPDLVVWFDTGFPQYLVEGDAPSAGVFPDARLGVCDPVVADFLCFPCPSTPGLPDVFNDLRQFLE